jgi:NADH-quinone oxidoreductase subunit J
VGLELFTKYILPFEMAAVLLLVALLGALLLARYPKTEQL